MGYFADLLDGLLWTFNFLILPAITYGSTLALGALGVTLIFGILRFAHFAHGDLGRERLCLRGVGILIGACTDVAESSRIVEFKAHLRFEKNGF